MAATAAVASSDSVHPDADAIRRLGSPAEADRHAALDHLCERWFARSMRMARGRVRRFYANAAGGQLEDLAEESRAEGWARLVKRVLASPLALDEPVDQTFEAYLRRSLGSGTVDHLRRDGTGSVVVPALKRLQRSLPDPAHGRWLQEMIDRQRAGLRWDDVTELSRSTGIAEGVLAPFIDEQVRPRLAQTHRAPPDSGGDTAPTPGERGDLFDRLMQRVDEIYRARTKGHLVASAMLRVLFTEQAVKGEWTFDHEMLMEELDAMGERWKSCGLPHAPGLPEARRCKRCTNALHQWRSRITEALSEDPKFQEAETVLREEGAFRQVGGRTGHDREASRVSDEEGRDLGSGRRDGETRGDRGTGGKQRKHRR
jgi:hypothetical protein